MLILRHTWLDLSSREPITRSIELPCRAYATAFSQVGLLLDKPFTLIAFEKPITSNCLINNKLLMCNQDNSFTLEKKNMANTVDQCIRKWDKLVAKFKQVEDNNKQTGKARQTCKFYDSLQECIGESRKVNPSYTFDVARVASSSSSQSDSNAECDDNGDELEDDESGNSLEGAKNGNKRVRKRKSHSSAAEMLTFLQSYSEKREKVEEEKISLLREMQKEKKEFFGQLLDVLKKK